MRFSTFPLTLKAKSDEHAWAYCTVVTFVISAASHLAYLSFLHSSIFPEFLLT